MVSFGTRLKEKRESLRITQPQLAEMLGVSKGAIGNWETDVNSPRAALLYDLFHILHCDANYLFQDGTEEQYKDRATPEEFENIIKKYRVLDDHGREMVDFTLAKEWERSIEQASSAVYTYNSSHSLSKVTEDTSPYLLNAAHERTDVEITEEMVRHDEDIMDDENF